MVNVEALRNKQDYRQFLPTFCTPVPIVSTTCLCSYTEQTIGRLEKEEPRIVGRPGESY